MFDTRPLEKITSIMLLCSMAVWPLLGVFAMIAGVLLGGDAAAMWGGLGCCGVIVGFLFAGAMQALMRWSRTGKSRPFLEEVTRHLGGGEVQTGTLLMALMSPRVDGSVDGFPYTLSLRRRGGILSPSEVGGSGLGWLYTVRMSANVGAKMGFGPPGQTMGAGLLGLSHDVQANGMTVWTGGTPRGHALAQHLSTLDSVRWITTFGQNGVILIVGPSVISVTGSVPNGVSPESTSQLVRAMAEVARIATSG